MQCFDQHFYFSSSKLKCALGSFLQENVSSLSRPPKISITTEDTFSVSKCSSKLYSYYQYKIDYSTCIYCGLGLLDNLFSKVDNN